MEYVYIKVKIYAMKYYSAITNGILSFAMMLMNLEDTVLHEINHIEKLLYFITYMWNLINKINKCMKQNRNKLIVIENQLVIATGERRGGKDKIGVWD